jgi:hypothetical protein
MMRNGVLYALPTSEPPTKETDGSAWPTPLSTDGEKCPSDSLARATREDLQKTWRKGKAKNWPTPKAEEHMDKNMRGNPTLTGAVKNWRTPSAGDGDRGIGKANLEEKRKSKVQITLAAQLREEFWPTPTAEGNNNRKGLSEKSGDGLSTAVKNWPTPKAQNTTGPSRHGEGGIDLQTEVLWSTPIYHDGKNTGGPSSQRRKTIELATQVLKDTKGMKLNPDWEDALMGFPVGWSNLSSLRAAGRFKNRGSPRAPGQESKKRTSTTKG